MAASDVTVGISPPPSTAAHARVRDVESSGGPVRSDFGVYRRAGKEIVLSSELPDMQKDACSIFLEVYLFAAGFIIGLVIFSSVTTAARHGLAISICPAVLESGNFANMTHRAGIVHRVSLDLFSLSITVRGSFPFVFEYKCSSDDYGDSNFINQGNFTFWRSPKKSESSAKHKNPEDIRNHISDPSMPSPKTSSLAEETQHRKIESPMQPSLSSQWQWAYGAGVENLARNLGTYSVKHFKDMYPENNDRNHKKKQLDRIWHYKYGSGR
jgi:hypothetical protein